MSEFPVDPVDLLAFNDVLHQVVGDIDSEPVERAVEFRHALGQVMSELRLAISLVDSTLIRRLESPIHRDGWRYEVAHKPEKQRYDHDRILSSVAKIAATEPETGESYDREAALQRLIAAVKALYLSPSVKAKAGGLKQYGIDRDSVETVEWGEKGVKVTDLRYTGDEA